MTKIVWALFLGLCLNSSWALEIQKDTLDEEEMTLEQPLEPLESTNPNKFSNLVKSTMDLMGPDLEVSQSTELTELSPE